MGKEILDNVPEQYKFWLSNGKGISSVNELHKELKNMNHDVFNVHVNESKNDFYNWVKDIYGDKALADDILECTTKEAMVFCLSQHLNKANVAAGFGDLPQGYSREKNLFEELPRGYPSQRVIGRTADNLKATQKLDTKPKFSAKKTASKNAGDKKKLATLINLKKAKNTGKKTASRKKVNTMKNNGDNSKIKPLDSNSIIDQIKGVYGF